MSILIYKQRFLNPNYKSTASKNYAHVRYIATRPRVARNAGMSHGLFGCLKPGSPLTEFPDWKEVARLVYQNTKRHVTMYRSVVSFEEETAKELRLTNQKAWQRYIENHVRTIAEKNGIRRENFSWAAAFHPEKGHPHVHVVFWDNSEEHTKIKNPFTHPSVPNDIRRQMIKDTFADRIQAYGEEKNRAAAEMRRLGDGLTEDFERHIRHTGRKKYHRLREESALEAELSDAFDFGEKVLDKAAAQVFKIRAALPKGGRIAYQLLPPELKKQVDTLVVLLFSDVPCLRKQKENYIESKMKMVYLYGGSETYLASRREMFGAEADKIIANRVLGMVKMLNRLEDEGRSADYLQSRRQDFAGQMLVEMLDLLEGMAGAQERQYAACLENLKTGGGELSKEARKELYLRNQDKGYEH
ncbi:MAG: relaxase MobL [Lachnospiraceae bacterium]|nr:relaxase MobL [Lachnospiraceae bacterium]